MIHFSWLTKWLNGSVTADSLTYSMTDSLRYFSWIIFIVNARMNWYWLSELTQRLTGLLTGSRTDLLIDWFTEFYWDLLRFTESLTHRLDYSLTELQLPDSHLIHGINDSLTHLLKKKQLADWLTHRLDDWQTDSLTDSMTHSLTHPLNYN